MKRNVLVTGSHRSGSTWIGRVHESSGSIDYVHEPFNLLHASNYNTPLKYWYEYIGQDTNRQDEFNEYLSYFMKGSLKCAMDRIVRNRHRKIPGILLSEYKKYRKRSMRKIVKDPIALFSADYLADLLDYQVIVSIRHPAAFAESLKNKDWKHDFTHFLSQELLMKEVLSDFRQPIEDFVKTEEKKADILEHAILLWNLVHFRILQYTKSRPDWIFVRHEDLSMDPEDMFRDLFNKLDLNFSESASRYIKTSTSGKETVGEMRDSRKNISKWARKLTQQEIKRIWEGTNEISGHFYSKEEWFGAI
jgi:hypothetical protein